MGSCGVRYGKIFNTVNNSGHCLCSIFRQNGSGGKKSDFRIQCGGIISLHNYIDREYLIVNIQTEKLRFIEELPK